MKPLELNPSRDVDNYSAKQKKKKKPPGTWMEHERSLRIYEHHSLDLREHGVKNHAVPHTTSEK